MTGEITLRGKVLPVGGLKEKLLAAHRAGFTTIIIPKESEKDLVEVPADVLEAMQINLVDTMDEVLLLALERVPSPRVPTIPSTPEIAPPGPWEQPQTPAGSPEGIVSG